MALDRRIPYTWGRVSRASEPDWYRRGIAQVRVERTAALPVLRSVARPIQILSRGHSPTKSRASIPLQVILMTISGLVNRHQADVIACLVEESWL